MLISGTHLVDLIVVLIIFPVVSVGDWRRLYWYDIVSDFDLLVVELLEVFDVVYRVHKDVPLGSHQCLRSKNVNIRIMGWEMFHSVYHIAPTHQVRSPLLVFFARFPNLPNLILPDRYPFISDRQSLSKKYPCIYIRKR